MVSRIKGECFYRLAFLPTGLFVTDHCGSREFGREAHPGPFDCGAFTRTFSNGRLYFAKTRTVRRSGRRCNPSSVRSHERFDRRQAGRATEPDINRTRGGWLRRLIAAGNSNSKCARGIVWQPGRGGERCFVVRQWSPANEVGISLRVPYLPLPYARVSSTKAYRLNFESAEVYKSKRTARPSGSVGLALPIDGLRFNQSRPSNLGPGVYLSATPFV